MKISLKSSEGKGIVKALAEVPATMFLSVSAGDEEEEEELVMCVYASASLAGVSLSIVVIVSGLPAHLKEAGTFTKRPLCSLGALILPAGTRLLLLWAPALPSGDGVPSVLRRRRLVRVDIDAEWDAEAVAVSGAPVTC